MQKFFQFLSIFLYASMKLIRTAKIKLVPSSSELDTIRKTFVAYTTAYNFVCQTGFDKQTTNGITLHKSCYQNTRNYLPSQLAISARVKASETLSALFSPKKKIKKNKKLLKCPKSKRCSIRLDKNSYTLFPKNRNVGDEVPGAQRTVSILTIDGRLKLKLDIPEYYEEYFQKWKYTSADLKIDRHQRIFLHIVFERDIEDVEPNGKLIGIDRGINNLAVISTPDGKLEPKVSKSFGLRLNKFFGGGKVKQIAKQYQDLRSKLQKKGTKSAKRHLALLKGRENRFRADVNHCIAKQIVSQCASGDTIVLEDLSGIRNKRLKKPQRILMNNWSFYQLELFIIYKAAAKGIKVEHIDPRYTSQRCSKCQHKERGNRKSQSDFKCKKCNYKVHADLNAARNICNKFSESQRLSEKADVNQPNGKLLLSNAHNPSG